MSLGAVLTLIVAAGATMLAAAPAAAGLSIGVTPAVMELTAKPGATAVQEITVANSGDQGFDAESAVADLHGATDASSAKGWLTVEPARFHLEPKQAQTLKVAIAVPHGLASGGYYAAVTVTTGATKSEGSAAGISGQIGVPFLFAVQGTGDLVREATLERFAPVLEGDGRIGFRALVRGGGNVYVVTHGKVEVAAQGKRLASLDFPSSGRILPDGERLVEAKGSLPLPNGRTFRATAAFTYDDQRPPLIGDSTFSVTPPAIAITRLAVCENLDRGPTLSLDVRANGDLGAQPRLTATVRQADGVVVGETSQPGALLWPNDTASFRADFPQRLITGQYVLIAGAQVGNGQVVTKEYPFAIGGNTGDAAPLCEPLSAVMTG